MADKKNFKLEQTKGDFKLSGIVVGIAKENSYIEGETKFKKLYKTVKFGVKTSNTNILNVEIYGQEFYLAHGDGMGDPDLSFRFLRGIFNNRFCQWLFSGLPTRWSMFFGLSWAKKSMQKHLATGVESYLGEDKEHLVVYAKDYLKTHPDINYFIFGHRHIELDLMLSSSSRVLIIGDWISHFTFAVFDGNSLILDNYIEGETLV